MPSVDHATRIAAYGLAVADVQPALTNLTVASGQKVVLTAKDANQKLHVRQLAPKQVSALKSMIGVPDAAVARTGHPVLSRPAVFSSRVSPQITSEQHISLWNSARSAILGHSASLSPMELAAVSQWIGRINPNIIIILYEDITVASNAQLILAPDVHVLYANNILIEQGGQIISQATIMKFDCASLKGFDGPPAGTGTGS